MRSHLSSAQTSATAHPIATGFDFEPLPTGDVLIEFFGDDGVTINTQVITKECLARIPVVAHALFLAVEEGKEAALAYLNEMSILENINERKANGFSI